MYLCEVQGWNEARVEYGRSRGGAAPGGGDPVWVQVTDVAERLGQLILSSFVAL